VAGTAALLLSATIGLAVGLVALERERERTATERDEKDRALKAETAEREEKERALEAQKVARKETRQALNKMTDDVVERLMARQVQLTESDRQFFREVLALYQTFASAQGDSTESRESIADGHYRVGLIRHKLGEGKDAEAAYRTALDLQERLAADFPTVP